MSLCRGGWNTEFLDELVSFPSGSHDDQVDVLSGAYGALAGVRPIPRARRRAASEGCPDDAVTTP